MNGAGATTAYAATKFGAFQLEVVTKNPELWCILHTFKSYRCVVNLEFNHDTTSCNDYSPALPKPLSGARPFEWNLSQTDE